MFDCATVLCSWCLFPSTLSLCTCLDTSVRTYTTRPTSQSSPTEKSPWLPIRLPCSVRRPRVCLANPPGAPSSPLSTTRGSNLVCVCVCLLITIAAVAIVNLYYQHPYFRYLFSTAIGVAASLSLRSQTLSNTGLPRHNPPPTLLFITQLGKSNDRQEETRQSSPVVAAHVIDPINQLHLFEPFAVSTHSKPTTPSTASQPSPLGH